jgi:hypothetical protein
MIALMRKASMSSGRGRSEEEVVETSSSGRGGVEAGGGCGRT